MSATEEKVYRYSTIDYTFVRRPDHPRAHLGGKVYQHIVVAETALGKYLDRRHQVHHVNGIKNDNRNQNLVICEDQSYHRLLHRRQLILSLGGDPNEQKICSKCRAMLPRAEFHNHKSTADGKQDHCKSCRHEVRIRRSK